MRIRFIAVAVVMLVGATLSSGCSRQGDGAAGLDAKPAETRQAAAPTAVYLTPEGGGFLAAADIAAHPQVAMVHDQTELASVASAPAALWIDKDAVPLLDLEWLGEKATKGWPIAVIGTPNTIYAFAGLIPFIVSVPYGAWPTPQERAERGFAVWRFDSVGRQAYSATDRGYPGTPTVDAVLRVTDQLLETSPLLHQ